MTSALRFLDYGFKYSIADTPALTHVNLDLPAGKIVAVIAPQGKGKTTLLRAAAGLLGEIYTGDVSGEMTPAGASAAFFDGYVRAQRDARALAVCAELNIARLVDRHVTQLSGGEEKLVGVAAALVPDAAIHILDEPFEQLDVAHFAAVIRAMKRRARAGRLVLVATASLDVALNIADAAVILHDGVWVYIDQPTYDAVQRKTALGASPVMEFLTKHHVSGGSVRHFRDAAQLAG
jgi:ABC-type multidrug transport system ATPase subunit